MRVIIIYFKYQVKVETNSSKSMFLLQPKKLHLVELDVAPQSLPWKGLLKFSPYLSICHETCCLRLSTNQLFGLTSCCVVDAQFYLNNNKTSLMRKYSLHTQNRNNIMDEHVDLLMLLQLKPDKTEYIISKN